MAKLADAADLKSAGRKAVGVQVPLRAPDKTHVIWNLDKRRKLMAKRRILDYAQTMPKLEKFGFRLAALISTTHP